MDTNSFYPFCLPVALLVRQQLPDDTEGIARTELCGVGLGDCEGRLSGKLLGAGEREAESSMGCHIKRIAA